MITILTILLVVSAIAKAIQDKLQFHFEKSVFAKAKNSWWNPKTSWKNKHNWFSSSKILTWIISNPLVLITDAWHFFGFIRDFSIFSCIAIVSGNYWFFLFYPAYRFVFHIFFTWIFTKNK